jgi:hypothetical protein
MHENPVPSAGRLAHHRAMPRVVFTPQLRRFTETPEVDSPAPTLAAALDDAFRVNPRLRGYILDDQGHLRANVVVFIDGERSVDRIGLSDPLREHSRVHVLQALSGG